MNVNGKKDGKSLPRLQSADEGTKGRDDRIDEGHIVFDFTGLHSPGVADLALILTARLRTPAHESVWVRAIDARTAYILRALGLDHLFRRYPGEGVLN